MRASNLDVDIEFARGKRCVQYDGLSRCGLRPEPCACFAGGKGRASSKDVASTHRRCRSVPSVTLQACYPRQKH